jgi:hypothetical protein
VNAVDVTKHFWGSDTGNLKVEFQDLGNRGANDLIPRLPIMTRCHEWAIPPVQGSQWDPEPVTRDSRI